MEDIIEKFFFDSDFGYRFFNIRQGIKQSIRRALAEYRIDITPEQLFTLKILTIADGLTQTELADICDKNKPNITRILDNLSRKGFVERHTDPNDRRCFRISITSKGRALFEELRPVVEQVFRKAFRGITKAEFTLLNEVQDKILRNLTGES